MTANWKTVPLGEIAEVKLGKMLDKAKHQTGRKFPYLRNINVRWGTVEIDDVFEMHFEDDQVERFGLRAGDVLVCEGGEPGRAAVWNGHVAEMKFQKAIHRVRFNVPFEARLLVYLLESLAKSGGLERRFTGSTIKHFTREAFVQLPIPFPPEDEQRRIVAEIEKQFTRLEAGVAALRRVQANLKRYRAAVLKAACEGRLVPTEAELQQKSETGEALLARILTERRQNWQGRGQYKEPTEPDKANPLSLPEAWACASVDQISENFDGRRVPLKSADRDKRSGQYPYYGASGIIDDIDDFLFDGDFLLIGEDGANLLSRSTPIAFKATGRFWVNNHAHIVQTRGGIPLAYLSIFLNGKDLSFSVTGSAQPKLTQAALNKIPVPLPPLAEQTRIVAEVERRLSVVEELESVVSANLQRATRLRQSILQKAFTGELI